MPFAAFLGATLGMLAIAVIQWLGMKFSGYYNEDGWYYRYVMPVFNSGLFGYIYVRAAYWVAPSYKFMAGVVMATILGMIFLAVVIFGWVSPNVPIGTAIQATVGLAAAIFGACVGLAAAHDEHPE